MRNKMDDGVRKVVLDGMEQVNKKATVLSEKFKDATIPDDVLYDELTKTCLEFTKYVAYMEKRAQSAQMLFWLSSLRTKAGVPKAAAVEATDEERAAAMRAVEMAEPVGPPPMPLTMPQTTTGGKKK
jgi:hypothetical protein